MSKNLPDDVTESMLPGNTEQDIQYIQALEALENIPEEEMDKRFGAFLVRAFRKDQDLAIRGVIPFSPQIFSLIWQQFEDEEISKYLDNLKKQSWDEEDPG